MGKHKKQIQQIAREVFQHESLRQGQEEAIESVLDGRDTLVVMPTGAGKSAIYQIAAVMLDGPAVVVSPLIALQKDQAEHLDKVDAGGSAVVNSQISERDREEAIAEAEEGETKFLFLAPEQFSNAERLAAVKEARPALFVVDEAHCISEWGHSFRPDYLRLKTVVEELGHPTVLALTATANQETRAEIVERLGMREPKIFVHGFDRPNLWLGVEMAASETKKHALLLERIRKTERPGIVYASTRKHAEQINDELNAVGISSAFYHGGLGKKDREAMQERFMNDEVEVIVATSAFGMGVDKPNVRFVFHYEAAGSLDSYYQEIGRAGRDGEPASAVLFYQPKDLNLHKFFQGTGQVGTEEVERVLAAVEENGAADANEVREKAGLSKTKVARALSRLEEANAIEIEPQGSIKVVVEHEELPEKAEEASKAQAERHAAELDRIEKMRLYAESLDCRRAFLLRYFGEETADECGNCDVCQGAGTQRAELIASRRMAVTEGAA